MATQVTNGLDLQNQRIVQVADPSSATDAANRQYVDNRVSGLSMKTSVRVATTTNGTLATAFANGQSVDGITLVTGDRILIKDQSTASQNGIYIVPSSGAPTRATDADAGAELVSAAMAVDDGTINRETMWVCNTRAPITVGTTGLTFEKFAPGSTYSAGAGISLSGTTFSADTTVVARHASGNIGNGSSTSIAFTHSLGTKDIVVSVRDTATDAFVLCDAVATDTNNVTLTFATAPGSAAYRVTVAG